MTLAIDVLSSPTREAGLARLRAFVPRMGAEYGRLRNHDPGPDGAQAVSGLSPYVRHRLLLEEDLVQAAWAAHGAESMPFIEQVMWRAYWKGWLEHRPGVWVAYREAVRRARDRLATEGGLRRVFHDAVNGDTGIDCFDARARELVATNRLHNHARMWFASIWIFTLRLPWALGADFFLRHLLDGDPASNTLSWRWVAGLHTRGKCYVARADNIARYTGGRFNPVGQLDEKPEPLTEDGTLPEPHLPPADDLPAGAFALLLHDEDCGPESLLAARLADMVAVGAVTATPLLGAHGVAAPVAAFARGALDDAVGRLERPAERLEPEAVAEWVTRQRCPVVTMAAPTGPTAELLAGLPVRQVRRAWDTATWPHARHGYFRMRERFQSILGSAISASDAGSAIRFVHELSA